MLDILMISFGEFVWDEDPKSGVSMGKLFKEGTSFIITVVPDWKDYI